MNPDMIFMILLIYVIIGLFVGIHFNLDKDNDMDQSCVKGLFWPFVLYGFIINGIFKWMAEDEDD